MRKNYLHLWLLLAAALMVVAAVSAFSPVTVGPWQLRDSGLMAALAPEPESPAAPAVDGAAPMVVCPDSAKEASKEPVPLDTAPKRILFIGDSMLDGLYPRLAAYTRHNGHELYAVIWYSSTSERWGTSDRLRGYIDRLAPDYIFICLGANELFVKNIRSLRRDHVRSILADIGSIPYLWIGPPNWKPDTGINALIADNAAPGSFFLSDGMTFDRAKDGAHPTHASAALWMDSVIRWMPAHSAHPIRLERPDAATGRAHRVFVHQPNE